MKKQFLVAIIVLIVIGGVAGGYVLYNYSQQPNIQAIQINISNPSWNPQTIDAQDYGTVASSGLFSYTATMNGTYSLAFDNSISTFSSKQVSVTYTTAGPSSSIYRRSFQVNPRVIYHINASLNAGQKFSGSFTVSGGSGNDIKVYLLQTTCTASVTYSFTLVNAGPVNGFVVVGLQADGRTLQSNRYFVMMGQQLQESSVATVPDCNSHSFSVVVLQQEKA